jgi:lysophospholipase L1-like esterase
MRVRRALLLLAIAAFQFLLFEAALRTFGHSEAAPSFQGLFIPDPVVGYRLRPHARTHYVTAEFDTHIAVNAQGVRDDRDIGPKPPNERRILVLGDSLVLSVQVEEPQTFCSLLEARLNRAGGPIHYRVINGGVQGYGPVQELLFFREVTRAFQPVLVIETIFVGNDAEDAVVSAPRLREGASPSDVLADSAVSRLRRLVRRSMVLQVLRLRVLAVTNRLPSRGAPPEAPLQTYAAHPAPRIEQGLRISRECVQGLAADAAAVGARTMVMLMPARFQLDDIDYANLREAVAQSGGTLIRDAATDRFTDVLRPVGLPLFDALPALKAQQAGPRLFFQQTVHLTPLGHEVVANALEAFLREGALLPGAADARR